MNKYSFLDFLKDDDGKFSSIRLGFLVFLIPLTIIWATISIVKFTLQDIPNGVCYLVGILAGSKVSQTWVHKRYSKNNKKIIKNAPSKISIFSMIWAKIKQYIPFLKKT